MNFPKLSWPRREPRQPDPPGVKTAAWLVKSAHAASWISASIASFFMWAFCVGVAGDQAEALHVTHAGTWVGDIEFFFPLAIGFAMIAFGVPFVAKNIISIFVSFSWKEHFWPKLWSLILVMATSVVLIAGSFSVMGGAIIEDGRGAAVAVEQVSQDRAALQAQIDAEQQELRDMLNNSNAYLAQAANVGADEWQRSYIDKTPKGDVQYDRIVRAKGAGLAADAKRANIKALRIQMAKSATVASVEATPTTSGTQWIADAISFVKGAWALMLSVLNDIICLVMGWLALRLEQKRNAELAMYADEAPSLPIMIEDHSAEAMPAVQPMQPTEKREQYFDEDGNKIVRRRATWAKVPTKKSGRKERDPETGKQVDDLTEYEAPAKSVSLNVDVPEEIDFTAGGPVEPEPEMETVAVAEPEAPAPVEPEPPEEEPAAEPEAPLILSDETVEALEGAGIVKDGELPDQFVTPEGDLNTEAVREHMANERGLPAPREDAEAA